MLEGGIARNIIDSYVCTMRYMQSRPLLRITSFPGAIAKKIIPTTGSIDIYGRILVGTRHDSTSIYSTDSQISQALHASISESHPTSSSADLPSMQFTRLPYKHWLYQSFAFTHVVPLTQVPEPTNSISIFQPAHLEKIPVQPCPPHCEYFASDPPPLVGAGAVELVVGVEPP